MPFKPGESGNPAGRPRGTTSQLIIREALDSHGAGESGLLQSIIESALAGDVSAAGLLIGRLYAPLKPTVAETQFSLDRKSPSTMAESILAAVADGRLAADVGKQLIEAVAATLRIREIDELSQRLEQLETKIAEAQR